MLKWFSISGILKEVKRIRWPHGKTLATNSLTDAVPDFPLHGSHVRHMY